MANKHRRHSSLDTLGWMYTHRARDEPPPAAALDRSMSTRIFSFRKDALRPTLKRQSSMRFNPGEYITGCFGPRRDSQPPILVDPNPIRGLRRPPRSRSISWGSLEFDFGSMRFREKQQPLAEQAAVLNRQAATHKQRVAQPGGRWVMEDNAEYYLKPPAWKQALRKLRAEAKRRVLPVRELSPVNNAYDAESYEKNFDDGVGAAMYMVVDEEADDFGPSARLRHSKLLTKLHSRRFESPDAAAAKLVKMDSEPPVLPKPEDDDRGVSIWERRVAAIPIPTLELTRSI